MKAAAMGRLGALVPAVIAICVGCTRNRPCRRPSQPGSFRAPTASGRGCEGRFGHRLTRTCATLLLAGDLPRVYPTFPVDRVAETREIRGAARAELESGPGQSLERIHREPERPVVVRVTVN